MATKSYTVSYSVAGRMASHESARPSKPTDQLGTHGTTIFKRVDNVPEEVPPRAVAKALVETTDLRGLMTDEEVDVYDWSEIGTGKIIRDDARRTRR